MNEPVAWIRQGEYGKPIIVQNPLHQFSYQAESAKWDDIPLYTHPANLTDEEIRVVWYGHPGFKDGLGVDPIPFAKAILRKAQEK